MPHQGPQERIQNQPAARSRLWRRIIQDMFGHRQIGFPPHFTQRGIQIKRLGHKIDLARIRRNLT
jgi:hypothetical protein